MSWLKWDFEAEMSRHIEAWRCGTTAWACPLPSEEVIMAPDRETNRDATGADLSRFVRQLASGATWGEAGSPVELIETHISWVALTPQYAYKVRKPVRFDFVDFSTLDRRRQDCIAEVELNRRLAPDVYLGVHALVEGPAGSLQLDGPGTPCEWVVKMRRL